MPQSKDHQKTLFHHIVANDDLGVHYITAPFARLSGNIERESNARLFSLPVLVYSRVSRQECH